MVAPSILFGSTTIDDAARQPGEATLLVVAQASPERLRGFCKARIRSTPGDVRIPMTPQAFDEIGRRTCLLIFLAEIHPHLRAISRRSLKGWPQFFLIRREPKPGSNASQPGVQKGGPILCGDAGTLLPPRSTIGRRLLGPRLAGHKGETTNQGCSRNGKTKARFHLRLLRGGSTS